MLSPSEKRLRTEDGSPRRTGTEDAAKTIRLATYNIRNGRNGGLEAALRAMAQANVDLGVFQETKLTEGTHTRRSSDYQVRATDAPSRHQGGVALFYRDSDLFQVEAYQNFGPNVISFQLVSGQRRWHVVGCYIPPTCTTTIFDLVMEEERQRGTPATRRWWEQAIDFEAILEELQAGEE